MKKIFIGCCGEGLGHLSRALSIVDHLPNYEIHIFTFGKALQFLKTIKYPYTHEIQGIMFSYFNHHVNYIGTLYRAAKFIIRGINKNIELIQEQYNILKPDILITDLEPSMPRAAKLLSKEIISIDNQHRFLDCNLKDLPFFLRLYCKLAGIGIKVIIPNVYKTIVSTFNFDCIYTDKKDVVITNGLLRKDIETISPKDMGFVLVYLRDSVNDIILDAIKNIKIRCKVYGSIKSELRTELANKDNFSFYTLSPAFINDLANCKCLISTAGNQLITEARFYGKPMLVIPEPGQYEQHINAFYVDKLQIGQNCSAGKLNEEIVNNFISNFKPLRNKVPNGVDQIINTINEST